MSLVTKYYALEIDNQASKDLVVMPIVCETQDRYAVVTFEKIDNGGRFRYITATGFHTEAEANEELCNEENTIYDLYALHETRSSYQTDLIRSTQPALRIQRILQLDS